MTHITFLLAGAMVLAPGIAGAQTPPPTQPPQKPTTQTQKAQPSMQTGQQVTISGCLRQTSDDPKVFALVDPKPSQQSGAQAKPGEQRGEPSTTQKPGQQTGGDMGGMHAPFYRLEDTATPSLKQHVDKRVTISGTVTPAKDEKGADIVSVTQHQAIGVTTTTIRAIDLKPAPTLSVKSVTAAGDCPAAKPKQ